MIKKYLKYLHENYSYRSKFTNVITEVRDEIEKGELPKVTIPIAYVFIILGEIVVNIIVGGIITLILMLVSGKDPVLISMITDYGFTMTFMGITAVFTFLLFVWDFAYNLIYEFGRLIKIWK